MNSRNRPPQAYPRETITKAYEWLHTQTPATREIAKDMETLVSLFLQDQKLKERRRKKTEDSSQFKETLKNLAEGVKTFSGDPRATPVSEPEVEVQELYAKKEPFIESKDSADVYTPPTQVTATAQIPTNNTYNTGFIDPKVYLQQHQEKQVTSTTQTPNSTPKNSGSTEIKNMLQTTQLKLNLSSEDEAYNALISLGYEQIKKIFL